MKNPSITTIPIFPMNNTILPNESIALHIFEPENIQLFQDCQDGKEFGVLYFNETSFSTFGTLVHIEQIINLFPNGTCDIVVKGDHIFELKTLLPAFQERLYPSAEVELKKFDTNSNDELNAEYRKYLEETGKMVQEEGESILNIANRLELSQEAKNQLISLPTREAMIKFLLNEIRLLSKIKQQESKLNKHYYLN